MATEVKTLEELKSAMQSGVTEIVTHDKDLVLKLKAIKTVKSWGPFAVAGIVAAVPVVIATGGAAAPVAATVAAFSGGAAATSAGVATSTIVAIIVVAGAAIAISLFSDWDYVEIGTGGIKMEKKKSKNKKD